MKKKHDYVHPAFQQRELAVTGSLCAQQFVPRRGIIVCGLARIVVLLLPSADLVE